MAEVVIRRAVRSDLARIVELQQPWATFYTKTMGFYDRVALSRMLRWTAFSDRQAARRSLDALLDHSFDQLIVGHGTPLSAGAKDAVVAAYAWLPPVTSPRTA